MQRVVVGLWVPFLWQLACFHHAENHAKQLGMRLLRDAVMTLFRLGIMIRETNFKFLSRLWPRLAAAHLDLRASLLRLADDLHLRLAREWVDGLGSKYQASTSLWKDWQVHSGLGSVPTSTPLSLLRVITHVQGRIMRAAHTCAFRKAVIISLQLISILGSLLIW